MKHRIEALSNAFNLGFELGRQYNGNPTDRSMKTTLKKAIEEGLNIMASQPSVQVGRAEACGCKNGGWFDFKNICINCGGSKTPAA